MAIGSLFTLFVIPSIYMLVAKDRSRDRLKGDEAEAEKAL
jgi:multidrug efflux pump